MLGVVIRGDRGKLWRWNLRIFLQAADHDLGALVETSVKGALIAGLGPVFYAQGACNTQKV